MTATDEAAQPVWMLRVAYDGSPFLGWQSQPTSPTVQGALRDAIVKLYCRDWKRRRSAGLPLPEITVRGCSRTDTGVHALAQLVSFTPPLTPAIPMEGARRGINSHLPKTIRVLSIDEKPPGFNTRHANVGKAYTYVLHMGYMDSPFLAPYITPTYDHLDLTAMEAAAAHLVGEHNFEVFTINKPGQDPNDMVRHIDRFQIRQYGRLVMITVVGERFLYRMVRRLVGILVAVGAGFIDAADVPAIRDGGERDAGFQTARPQGLYLEEVFLDAAAMARFVPGPPPFLGLLGLPAWPTLTTT